jgi:hypothetical protein
LRRVIPFLWRNLNPLHPRMICAKSGQNWPSSSREEVENVKVYRQTDRQIDAGQRAIRKAHLIFQLRWAKNVICYRKCYEIRAISAGMWMQTLIQSYSVRNIAQLTRAGISKSTTCISPSFQSLQHHHRLINLSSREFTPSHYLHFSLKSIV